MELEGHSVFLQTVSGGTPEEIKEWIIERNDSGSKGTVLIGDITAAWAEVSGSVFPCDLFYMDLDGNWEDNDDDGDYEIHTEGDGDMGPELYVGRIYATTLTYDSEANMVNDYLEKIHAYRMGELTQPWRGLEYVEEDWYDMDVNLDYIYGDDVVRYDYGYHTTAQDYLNQMDLGQHFVQVCAHSYSGGHHFGTRPTESASYAHVYVYSPTARPAKLLLGSDDGIKVWLNNENIFTIDRYGSWHEDDFEVDVTLNEGWNQLLCKISQENGEYKLSARFTDTDYSTFDGLIYQINNPDLHGEDDPEPTPITHIGTWLINGPYANPSSSTRLSTDYLGDERNVTPSEGDPAPFNTWEMGMGNGCPFDLDTHFDHGDWVLSQDIQDRDPPVLFYNLFSCGPGLFTDENYLAGAYIFHTTYGLITIASSKSGSMLNFDDFTRPLGEGKSIGEAFYDWFDAQAPFQQWEKEWYYGMVVCGDPTLCIPTATQMKIEKPENEIYFINKEILPFFTPLIFGKIDVDVYANNIDNEIDRVEFFVDGELKEIDTSEPYSWTWDERVFFRHTLKVVAYDTSGVNATRKLEVWKFF